MDTSYEHTYIYIYMFHEKVLHSKAGYCTMQIILVIYCMSIQNVRHYSIEIQRYMLRVEMLMA